MLFNVPVFFSSISPPFVIPITTQVINALAKSGEPSAAARAERVLHNMVNRHKLGASDDVKPTTINFNSVRGYLFVIFARLT